MDYGGAISQLLRRPWDRARQRHGSPAIKANPAKTLPSKPSSLCRGCWEGPFAAHLGLLGEQTSQRDEGLTKQEAAEVLKTRKEGLDAGGYSYKIKLKKLKRRAAAGCVWCRFLSGAIPNNPASDVLSSYLTGSRGKNSGVTIAVGRSTTSEVIDVYYSTPRNVQGLSVACEASLPASAGFVYTDENDPAAPYIVARPPVLDVGSSRAMSLAQSCIAECTDRHATCKTISGPDDSPLPTRLIDCSHPHAPRLVFTYGQRGRYLALSYVWGEDQPHSTTSSNVSAYIDGIDPTRLPQTIRDAILVTHSLGFQFLWADSLCIIQDSIKDQRHEIGRMHIIYRRAYLTIIAASAGKVNEGFLQDRSAVQPDITLPFICPPSPSSSDAGHTADRTVKLNVGQVYVSREQLGHRTPEPIDARAWCMQEYLMSPRALIFTSKTLQFRCQTATRNVGRALCIPRDERRLPDVLFLPHPPALQYGSAQWTAVHDDWLRVVEDYSQRMLSDQSDKLVACGAIAREFHRLLGSDYLAGLWRETILVDLLWQKAESDSPYLERSSELRAPSWSWASVQGGVRMVKSMWPRAHPTGPSRQGAITRLKLVRCEVTLEDDALPFGRVTGGSLLLRTTLLPCMLDGVGLYPPLTPPGQTQRGLHLEDGVEVDHGMPRSYFERLGWASMDTAADSKIQNMLWAVLISLDTSDPFKAPEGLLVVPSDTVDTGSSLEANSHISRRVYRRVGYFRMERRGVFDDAPAVDIELV